MTDRTQPEALRLAEILEGDYCPDWFYEQGVDEVSAELRRQHARIAELEAQLEAIGAGGVNGPLVGIAAPPTAQAEGWTKLPGQLPEPGMPAGWKAVPVNPTPEMWKAAKSVPDPNPPYPPHYALVWDAMLAASPTPPAEGPIGELVVTKTKDGQIVAVTRQDDEGRILSVIATSDPAEQQAAPKAAPGVGNSGFDHKTAADLLNNKTVSDEAVRTFVAASRWAHDERAALSATLLAMHGVLTSREAEIALLKKALLEAETAPQQEAQEPSKAYAWVYVNKYGVESIPASKDWCTAMVSGHGGSMFPLYTAPLPAPAPLSDDTKRLDWLDRNIFSREMSEWDAKYGHGPDYNMWVVFSPKGVQGSARNIIDAALAAQGGKDAE